MKQYPIFRPESSVFVSQELVTPWEVTNEKGVKYLTSALKIGKEFDLIALSLGNETTEITDYLKPEIRVERIMCSIESGPYRQVFAISSLFEDKPAVLKHKEYENQRKVFLDFEANTALEMREYSVICRLKLTGVASLDTGSVKVDKATLQFVSAQVDPNVTDVEAALRKKTETIDVFGVVLSYETYKP